MTGHVGGKVPRQVFLGAPVQAWVFFGGHAATVAALILCRTDLAARLDGALSSQGFLADKAFLALVVSALALHSHLFLSLLRGDPGHAVPHDPTDPQAGPPNPEPCGVCGATFPLRTQHDKVTGRCIARFDHYCIIIGAALGDKNHARFWYFLALETTMALYALCLCIHALLPCLLGWQPHYLARCWEGDPWRTTILAVLLPLALAFVNGVGGFWLLHTWLAASGQTTAELLRGARVPYLQPYYANYAGPDHVSLTRRGLGRLYALELRGRGPPRPFSQGLLANLNMFFLDAKPTLYMLPAEGPALL